MLPLSEFQLLQSGGLLKREAEHGDGYIIFVILLS